MNYKDKYLKYKQKYFALKIKQLDSGNNICEYGSLCYRTNVDHNTNFIHKCIYCGKICKYDYPEGWTHHRWLCPDYNKPGHYGWQDHEWNNFYTV